MHNVLLFPLPGRGPPGWARSASTTGPAAPAARGQFEPVAQTGPPASYDRAGSHRNMPGRGGGVEVLKQHNVRYVVRVFG